MTILLRKLKREGVALIRLDGGLLRVANPARPSLLQTVGVFALAILFPLLALALTALAGHLGVDGSVLLAVAPIVQLRADRDKLVKKANAAMTAAQELAKKENRALTAEELKAQDDFDAEIKAIDDNITLEQRKLTRERGTPAATAEEPVPGSGPQPQVRGLRNRTEDDTRARGFRNHREYLTAVAEAEGLRVVAEVPDERLRPLALVDKEDKKAKGELAFLLPEAFTPQSVLAAAGSDEQGTYNDTYGGFAVPGPTRLPGILSTGFEGDPTAGRTQPIPMETPSVEIMARTDKDHTTSVSGGFTVGRKAETVAATASRSGLEMIVLKAASLFGFGYSTEELLTDSPSSFIAIIDSGFRDQFPAEILNEKIRGLGGNQFLGVLNSPAKIEQAVETNQAADTIVGRNIIKMASRIWGYGASIWMANHDCKPQLYELQIPVGTTSALLYQPSKQEGFPDMMLGRPVFYNEFCSKLGDVGDVMGVNWSQFLEGLYQPLKSAESVHVRFDRHERAFKFWLRNAGAPWWRSALTPAKSAVTLSPIVTLAAR